MINILLIDEDHELHEFLKLVFPKELILHSAYTGKEGIECCDSLNPAVVLLDIGIRDCDGFTVLKTINASLGAPPVIIYSGSAEIPQVVKAMKLGACDYLQKPKSMYELRNVLLQALTARSQLYEQIYEEIQRPELNAFIGKSRLIQKVKYSALRYAKSESSLLLTGESGTGKDIIAELIHSLSRRSQGPFIARNCGAVPAALLESELFGSERGAYTDAVNKPGSFELANGGTLFLDEIGEMDLQAQVKLLRAIEKKEVMHVGGTRNISVNVRIIAATNAVLEEAIQNKKFRKDLFFRINTLAIHLPPLRERKEDIPLLVEHFLSTKNDKTYYLSPPALEKLMDHSWPGNIRELKNVLERSVLLSDSVKLEPEHIQLTRIN